MPRFVLLHHACPPGYERPSHWDLMFETAGALRTWALAQLPCDWRLDESAVSTRGPVDAEQLPDHRTAYLDYEGPISGARGQVTRVDSGSYEILSDKPDRFEVRLAGAKLHGTIVLTRLTPAKERWTLSVEPRAQPNRAM